MADSITTLAARIADRVGASADALGGLEAAWRNFAAVPDPTTAALAAQLAECTATPSGIAGQMVAADDAVRRVIASWAVAMAGRGDLVLAPLLTTLGSAAPAAEPNQLPGAERGRDPIERAARRRVDRGPLRDALACLALTGDGAWLAADQHRAGRARVELLLWQGGADALSVPELGPWLFRHGPAISDLVLDGASGSLRQRALAACALAVAADGARAERLPNHLQTSTERLLRRLASHPEPVVWIPAARAIGRLAVKLIGVRRLLSEWLDSDNLGERRRAVTALASMPEGESLRGDERLASLLEQREDPWIVAALGPAIPYLASERRTTWEQVAGRLEAHAPPPEVWWSVTQGLATLARRQPLDRVSARLLDRARQLALAARPHGATEAKLWHAVRADSDFVDGLEPDPSDPDRLLVHQVTAALRVGARPIAERARFVARSLAATFATALPTAFERTASPGEAERRAASCATLESCARAAALALWEPILRSVELDPAGLAAEIAETRAGMVCAIAPRMAVVEPDHVFHRAALRVLGYAVEIDLRGALDAVETAPWLAAPGRELGRFRKPLADFVWHVVDSTRGSSLVADPMLFPRFAAWWALSSAAGTALLEYLSRAEAAARVGEGGVLAAVEAIRRALGAEESARPAPDRPPASDGGFVLTVLDHLAALGAADTALAEWLAELAGALDAAAESRVTLAPTSLILALGLLDRVRRQLGALLRNPRQALSTGTEAFAGAGRGQGLDPSDAEAGTEVTALAQTVRRSTQFDVADYAARWSAELGPLLAPRFTRAVTDLLLAHLGRDATADSSAREQIGGYRLIKILGEGEMGAVWLVCDPRTGRHFVMKLPARAFAACPPAERKRLAHAVSLEAEVLRTIHHPNLASMIDYGWDEETPYLVLEYLVGVDLEEYLATALLTLEECQLVVADLCAGLQALHARGLVHRDLKPGNVFLRLDLGAPGSRFDPRRHRHGTPLLGAVIIDFGIAAKQRASDPGTARVVTGTLGFIAPEQARGTPAVDGKADVYSLAALIYASLTGWAFFEELDLDGGEWIEHHRDVAPLAAADQVRGLPRDLARLLRDASALDPAARPDIASFAARFAALG